MTDDNKTFPYRDYQRDALQVTTVLRKSGIWLYLVLGAIILTPLLVGWFSFHNAADSLQDQHRQHNTDLARQLQSLLDADTLARLPAADSNDAVTTTLRARLRTFTESHPRPLQARLLLLIGEDLYLALESAEPDRFMALLRPDSVRQLQLVQALKLREPWYQPASGTNASSEACLPLPARTGNYPAMSCVALQTGELQAARQSAMATSALITLLALLISLAVVFSVIQHQKQYRLALDLIQKQRDLFLNSALTDPLTNALNRRAFHIAYASAQSQLHRNGLPFALLMLDIDHFKMINDRFGHDRGDKVLSAMTTILGGVLRSSDHLARLGGEEFCIICNIPDSASAVRMANKLRAAIETQVFDAEAGETVTITISIGIHLPDHNETMEEALKHADTALYEAKKNGRNRVEVYSPG